MSLARGGLRPRTVTVSAAVIAAMLCLSRGLSADVYYRMLFERAVFLLETRIEPLDAIPIFQEIVGRHGDDRPYAARSQLYIGLCYKKAGSERAAQAFRKVLADYPEQRAVGEIAAAELGGLKADRAEPRDAPAGATRLVRRFAAGERIGGLSRDGRSAVLTEMGTDGLAVFHLTDQETRPLARSRLGDGAPGFAEQAAISPDGSRIIYAWRRDSGEVELRSVGADGTGATVLLSSPGIAGIGFAAWRSSGDRFLAVLSGPGAVNRAALISAVDGSVAPVMDLGSRWPERLLPSPDGRYIAFGLSADPMRPDGDIFLYSIADKTTEPLVRQAGDDRLVAWTPDGRGIVYAGGGPGTAGLWLLAVEDGRPQPPARWIAEDIGPFEPVGLDGEGSLYFRVLSGGDGTAPPGGERQELWVWPRFLPEKSRVLTVPDAFPSIRAALAAASAGDTVLIKPGTYRETVVVGKPLHLRGEDRRTTVIAGDGAGSVVRIAAGDVTVSGLTVSGGTDGIEIAAGPAVLRVLLRDVAAVHNSRDGIRSAKTGGYHRIEGCTVSDNGLYGMNVHQFLRSVIRDCDVFRNGTGLRPAWSWHILVEGNRVHHNRASGLLVDSCYNSTVSGNLIHANDGAGLSIYYIAGRNTIKENILVRNGAGIDINLHWGGFGENRFFHNDLVENGEQVRLTSAGGSRFQLWDMGDSVGGNFWSDHARRDAGEARSRGKPYDVAGGARDRFPLARPVGRISAELSIAPSGAAPPGPKESLTAHIELPAGLPLEEIEPASLRLNGSVPPIGAVVTEKDVDGDGVPDLEVRFPFAEALRVIGGRGAGREAFVAGKLRNGLSFEARELGAGRHR